MATSDGDIVKDMLTILSLCTTKQTYALKAASNILRSNISRNTLVPTISKTGIEGFDTTTKLNGYPLKLLSKVCQTMAIHIMSLKP